MALPRGFEIDGDDRVVVWHLFEKKWKRLRPIDAREQLVAGNVSLAAPEEAPEKPPMPQPDSFDPETAPIAVLRGRAEKAGIAGAVAMSLEELRDALRAKEQEAAGGETAPDPFADLTVDELRARAKAAGVAHAGKLNRLELVAALTQGM
jgi:hypothetical protein